MDLLTKSVQNLELFVLLMKNDTNDYEDFFFLFDRNKITSDKIYKALQQHKEITENEGIEYNYVLAIRKLEGLGLKQIMTHICSI